MTCCSRAREGELLCSSRNASPLPSPAVLPSACKKSSAAARLSPRRCACSAWRGPGRKGSGPTPASIGLCRRCCREVGIAFDFGRPPFVGFDHQRHRAAARRHGRGKILRDAVGCNSPASWQTDKSSPPAAGSPSRPSPASRNEADMTLTKLRRDTGSFNSLAPAGNSRSTHWRNSGVSAS